MGLRTIRSEKALAVYDTHPREFALGEFVFDEFGRVWRMCLANEDLVLGEVVQENVETITGTVTTAAAVGTRLLIDSAAFAALTDARARGMVGTTRGSLANGGGQNFRVIRRVDDNTLEVMVEDFTSAANVGARSDDGGWGVALTTSTTFGISLPGEVVDCDQDHVPVGVAQIPVDQSVAPYFFALVWGRGSCMVDDSDSDFVAGGLVYVSTTTDGRVEGPTTFTATPTVQELEAAVHDLRSPVGMARSAEPDFDCLIAVDINCQIGAFSRQRGRMTHPLMDVTV